MKKKPFSLCALLRERRKELFLTLFVLLYLLVFVYVEATAPTEGYWVSYLPIDDKIPFVEEAIVFYLLWFPFIVGTGLFLFVKDAPAYRRYIITVVAGYMGAMLLCVLIPNGQNLRPEYFLQDNLFTRLVGWIYSIDTNTNVFPSVHVIGSYAAAAAWFDSPGLRAYRLPAALFACLISLSTVFVKQHSALDLIGAAAVCIILYLLIYRRSVPFDKRRSNIRS